METPTTKYRNSYSIVTLLAVAAGLSLTACEVEKKQEGEMPKVNVEGGKMPQYDVKGPDVRVEQKKKEITVPDVDIVTPKEKREGGNIEPGETKPEGSTTPAPNPPPAQNPPAQ